MKPLPRRRLGTNGLEITTVGFGAWAVGGGGWAFGWGAAGRRRPRSPRSATRSRAASTGSTPRRSTGSATPRRSSAARSRDIPRAERPLVFTKCGLRLGPETTRWQVVGARLEPGAIRDGVRGVAAAPRRRARSTSTSSTGPTSRGRRVEDSWGDDGEARRRGQGALRSASRTSTSALLERCEALRHVESLQPPFSLIRRDVAARGAAVVPGARHRRDRATARCSPGCSPTASRPRAWRRCADDDWRRRAADFQEPSLSRNLALRDALRAGRRSGTA